MTLSVPDKANVNAKRWTLLPRQCKSLLPSGFTSQRDAAPAHTAKLAQDWIATNCSEFIGKSEWPPNSPDVNPLDYHVWRVMLEHYKTFYPKPKNTDGLKKVLQLLNMKPAVTGLNQQGHTELHKKHIERVWTLGWTLRMCFEKKKLLKDAEH